VAHISRNNKLHVSGDAAKDVVDAVVRVLAIRVLAGQSEGRLEWEQIGFGGDANW